MLSSLTGARTGRARRTSSGGVERLARFSGEAITFPALFGGGFASAVVGQRTRTVAFGYPGVVEEFTSPDTGAQWCALSVSLPNTVPLLVADHRCALGRVDVPTAGGYRASSGDDSFDEIYLVTAESSAVSRALVTPALRAVLLRGPVQRMAFSGSRLLLRTFDGNGPTDAVVDSLHGAASDVLQATPGFVSRLHPDERLVFPRGVCGPLI